MIINNDTFDNMNYKPQKLPFHLLAIFQFANKNQNNSFRSTPQHNKIHNKTKQLQTETKQQQKRKKKRKWNVI